jgi:hypothetical protein
LLCQEKDCKNFHFTGGFFNIEKTALFYDRRAAFLAPPFMLLFWKKRLKSSFFP